jgi:hypothetical protein
MRPREDGIKGIEGESETTPSPGLYAPPFQPAILAHSHHAA